MSDNISCEGGPLDDYHKRIKISINTDISVIGFYGNIGNIGKYRWKFLQKYRFD